MNSKKKFSITVVISAYNETDQIKDCIASAKQLTRAIIVIDIGSQDKTVEIAKKSGADVIPFPFSSYVEPSRQFAINAAQTDWVLILDADERITSELAIEIKQTIQASRFSSYKISRKNIFGKQKWLKHGGWWPDYQIRLINKNFFVDWPKTIHSTPVIKGNCGLLQNPLLHYFHGDIESMVKKTVIFEDIESDLLLNANKPVSSSTFFRKFLGELNRRLLIKRGFMDGTIGIIEAIYQAFSKTITYLYLYEKKSSRSL